MREFFGTFLLIFIAGTIGFSCGRDEVPTPPSDERIIMAFYCDEGFEGEYRIIILTPNKFTVTNYPNCTLDFTHFEPRSTGPAD